MVPRELFLFILLSSPLPICSVSGGRTSQHPLGHQGSFLSFLLPQFFLIPRFPTLLLVVVKLGASLVAQMVKNLPAVQETEVQPLGWEDPLEKGNGNPLQYFCLENPMNKGAWWATVHVVKLRVVSITYV